MHFINRKHEMRALENFWDTETPQLLIMYGKRRVGKTELIKHFLHNKPAVYFLARQVSEKDNLGELGRCVGEYFEDVMLANHGFTQWDEVFSYIAMQYERKKIKRFALAIDEFPYLAEVNKGMSSIFQAGWDEYLKNIPVFLILCGSSISMMEQETLAYKAPLYGRRTGQLFIKPMLFSDIEAFFPDTTFEEKINRYSICGGIPSYARKLSMYSDIEEAIVHEILTPEMMLYNEVEFILHEELREPRYYFSILKAIAMNCTKLSEIMNETGMDKTALHNYLYVLEQLHLIEKRVPVTEHNPHTSRKGRYYISDPFFKFWFRYCFKFKSELEWRNTRPSMRAYKETFKHIVAENYEKIAQEIMHAYSDIFHFDTIGKWWDKDTEIDFIAMDDEREQIIFGEVKWTNKQVGNDILYGLKEKAKKVRWGAPPRKEFFCLFSRSGFTTDLHVLATKGENIFLFEKDRLLGHTSHK